MYTVRFQLELSGSEKRFLSKSFFYANQMHNQLVRYATNRLKVMLAYKQDQSKRENLHQWYNRKRMIQRQRKAKENGK